MMGPNLLPLHHGGNNNLTWDESAEAPTTEHMLLTPGQEVHSNLSHVLKCDEWFDNQGDERENDCCFPEPTPVAVVNHSVKKDRYIVNPDTKKREKMRQLRLCVECDDMTRSWVHADAIRLQDPALIVIYASCRKLLDHDDFKWVKKEYDAYRRADMFATYATKRTPSGARHKFGTQVANTPSHALALDKQNGNQKWKIAMDTELKQINDYKTFIVLEDDDPMPPGYKRIPYHVVFDIKFDLRHKARLVAGGNHTENPREDIYSGVVGMETIRLGFVLAAMNNLQCCAADVGNAFLCGKTREKVYIIAGPEFGENAGKRMIIDKGLYGLKTSSARFHEHLSSKLRLMGFAPSKADADLWMRPKDDHCEYIATCVDDLLVWSRDCNSVINTIKEDYILKGVGKPDYYLGGDVKELDNSWTRFGCYTSLSAETYISNVVTKLQELAGGPNFPAVSTPMDPNYHPEMDETPELDSHHASTHRAFIGSGNWLVALGRIDIAYTVNTLARFSMKPRWGHLKAAFRLFGYLRKNPKQRIIIDPNLPDWSSFDTTECDTWKEFYPEAQEDLPDNVPVAKGPEARITVYVDADHAHDKVTRRSVTGIILFVNGTPVKWISKRQKTVETSTYGSELVAARIAVEAIMEHRYNLRMLGVKVSGPSLLLGDNKSVILNTTVPSSMLNKKHLACNYHRVREAVAAGVVSFVHVDSGSNLADLLTKPLARGLHLTLTNRVIGRVSLNEKISGGLSTLDGIDPAEMIDAKAEI